MDDDDGDCVMVDEIWWDLEDKPRIVSKIYLSSRIPHTGPSRQAG